MNDGAVLSLQATRRRLPSPGRTSKRPERLIVSPVPNGDPAGDPDLRAGCIVLFGAQCPEHAGAIGGIASGIARAAVPGHAAAHPGRAHTAHPRAEVGGVTLLQASFQRRKIGDNRAVLAPPGQRSLSSVRSRRTACGRRRGPTPGDRMIIAYSHRPVNFIFVIWAPPSRLFAPPAQKTGLRSFPEIDVDSFPKKCYDNIELK